MLCLMRHSMGIWYRLCTLINNFRESCPWVPKLAPHYSTPTQRLIKADKICFSQIVGDAGSNALNRRILENFCFVVFSILMLSQTKHTKLGFSKNSDFQICLKAFQNRAPAIQSPGIGRCVAAGDEALLPTARVGTGSQQEGRGVRLRRSGPEK